MQIIKEAFQIKIAGKCTTKTDVIELFNFGMSKKDVIKKYKKDNKLKTQEAMKFVESVIFEYVTGKRI